MFSTRSKKLALGAAVVLLAVGFLSYRMYSLANEREADTGKRVLPEPSYADVFGSVSAERLQNHVNTLASFRFRGRLAGDSGQYMAAEYIANEFASYGLKPVGDNRSYYQWFRVPFWQAGRSAYLKLSDTIIWKPATDFAVFTYSGSVNVKAQVVFVGYGISLPSKIYDDYEGIDVTGKIVLVFRHGPREDMSWHNEFGVWAFGYKATNAVMHGAVGMILVNDYRHGPEFGSGTLLAESYHPNFGAIWTHRRVGETLLNGTDFMLQQLADQIDSSLKPSSVVTPNVVEMQVSAEFDPARSTMNVLGAIEGQDTNVRDEVVIVSAHYDHLGIGAAGEIYLGADDDASGTAAVLETARVLAQASTRIVLKRSVLFAAWTAEEIGLLGSSYYVRHPIFSLEKTIAVLQLDMVGVGSGGLIVFNGQSFTGLADKLRQAGILVGLPVSSARDSGASDHAPFGRRGVPAVLLFTQGDHPNYHTPGDKPELINAQLMATVTRAVVVTAWSLSSDRPITTTTSTFGVMVTVIVTARRIVG